MISKIFVLDKNKYIAREAVYGPNVLNKMLWINLKTP